MPSELKPGSPSYVILQGGDWTATIRQTLPIMPRVMVSLRPTWILPTIAAIEPDFLSLAGIRTLIWDVDGTLTHHHSCALAPEATVAFRKLLAVEGLQHVIASNCGESRFRELAAVFPGVPVVKAYRTSKGLVSRIRIDDVETWSGAPEGQLTPLRKPDPQFIREAVLALGVTDFASVAMVGDQHLTDIAAANLAGIRSIKVPTSGPASRPLMVRLLQEIDAALYLLMKRVSARPGDTDFQP